MPARVPEMIREDVLQSWLGGSSFHAISIKHAISEGSINNIIAEKKKQHGSDQMNFYRELGVAMSKSGLNVQQCAEGYRVAMLLRNLGVDEEKFEGFISRLGKLYVNAGLGPEILAKQIDELHYFLEKNQNLSGTVSVHQICNDINSRQAEKKRLQDDITFLKSKKYDSEKELSEVQSLKLKLETELGLTKELNEKINDSGLKNDEIRYCIDLGLIVKGCGFSPHEITERFSSFAELGDSLVLLRNTITQERIRYDQLARRNTELEESNSKYSQRLRELALLYETGFGLAEFKQLRNLIEEIAEALGVPVEMNAAVKWFFENLLEHWYDYLDLGKAVREHRAEIANLKLLRDYQSVALNLTPELKNAIDSLLRTGIKKDEIERISKLIEQNHISQSPTLLDKKNRISPSLKPRNSDSSSEQGGEIPGKPRSTHESADDSCASEAVEKGDIALHDSDPQSCRDGDVMAEDNPFKRGIDRQEEKNRREEEENSSRVQSVLQSDRSKSDQSKDDENDDAVGLQLWQKDCQWNDIFGFLRSFISRSRPDVDTPRESQKAKFDTVDCASDSAAVKEYAGSATSKHDPSQLNLDLFYAAKEHGKALSNRLPSTPPALPRPKRLPTVSELKALRVRV